MPDGCHWALLGAFWCICFSRLLKDLRIDQETMKIFSIHFTNSTWTFEIWKNRKIEKKSKKELIPCLEKEKINIIEELQIEWRFKSKNLVIFQKSELFAVGFFQTHFFSKIAIIWELQKYQLAENKKMIYLRYSVFLLICIFGRKK